MDGALLAGLLANQQNAQAQAQAQAPAPVQPQAQAPAPVQPQAQAPAPVQPQGRDLPTPEQLNEMLQSGKTPEQIMSEFGHQIAQAQPPAHAPAQPAAPEQPQADDKGPKKKGGRPRGSSTKGPTKADRVSVVCACASAGLSPEQCDAYLAKLEAVCG